VSEPLHAVTYFAAESFAAWEAVGLKGFWRGYFATRAAPFGAVGPELVTATFFNFAPEMVARALPAVWAMASPEQALAARATGATGALRAILGDATVSPDVAAAAEAARAAVGACSPAGRALFAANAGLPWPEEPLAALWHGLTCLREHRGDGHNAALVVAGIDGCQAHVLASAAAAGGAARQVRQGARGWNDEEWAVAVGQLRDRGLLDGDDDLTPAGAALHTEIEARTDAAALEPWASLGPEATARLEAALHPLATAVVASGVVRFPNPMGLPPLEPAEKPNPGQVHAAVTGRR
jgi:hypothetical protein